MLSALPKYDVIFWRWLMSHPLYSQARHMGQSYRVAEGVYADLECIQ